MLTRQYSIENLTKSLKFKHPLYLKREDEHIFYSHKGRSIPYMIYHYISQGYKNFVISSSGNASLAAVKTILEYNQKNKEKIKLKIFVGNNINEIKLEKIQNLIKQNKFITLNQVANPKQSAFMIGKRKNTINLRQSTDDLSLIGYKELAKELLQIKDIQAIFIPSSSGTLAQGLYLGFKENNLKPQIHIVQTTGCHSLLNKNDKQILKEKSLADAIVDKIAYRKKIINEIIKETSGAGWIVDNSEILQSIKQLETEENIKVSANGILGIAGFKKALKNNWDFKGTVVCLITGW